MYRIRLAAGQEASYRSIEELSHAIRRGVVTADAELFHTATGQWVRIGSRREYGEAIAVRASARRESGGTEVPSPATVPVALPGRREGVAPVYQMSSHSARELEARRPSRWMFPVVTGMAALALVITLAWDGHPIEGRAEEGLPLGLLPRRVTRQVAHPAVAQQGESLPLTPETLAERYASAGARAAVALDSAAREAGLSGLNAASRLTDTDSTRAALTALATFALMLQDHRTGQQLREAAYRDTASFLMTTRRWTAIDLAEWRARVRRDEPRAEAQRADSLLAALEDLYTVLRNSSRGYRYDGATLRFARPEAAGSYREARARVERLRVASGTDSEWPAPAPLRVLSNSIVGGLPPGH